MKRALNSKQKIFFLHADAKHVEACDAPALNKKLLHTMRSQVNLIDRVPFYDAGVGLIFPGHYCRVLGSTY